MGVAQAGDEGMTTQILAEHHVRAKMLEAEAARAIAKVEAERDARIAAIDKRIAALRSGEPLQPSPLTVEGDFYVRVPAEAWSGMMAEVCAARIEKLQAALVRMVAAAEREGLPPGTRQSWRRGTWA